MKSTDSRVPLITGLPARIRGSLTMRATRRSPARPENDSSRLRTQPASASLGESAPQLSRVRSPVGRCGSPTRPEAETDNSTARGEVEPAALRKPSQRPPQRPASHRARTARVSIAVPGHRHPRMISRIYLPNALSHGRTTKVTRRRLRNIDFRIRPFRRSG
ncbi:MAG: hypothetical protein RLY70_3887 [Planctomycetota bacterium]